MSCFKLGGAIASRFSSASSSPSRRWRSITLSLLQEKRTPLLEFVERLELDTLDTRFRYRPRGATRPDPRIVIVDIDQHSQEVLGRWPFPRTYFAKMLDALHNDGAKVVGSDITFSKPELDRNSAASRAPDHPSLPNVADRRPIWMEPSVYLVSECRHRTGVETRGATPFDGSN